MEPNISVEQAPALIGMVTIITEVIKQFLVKDRQWAPAVACVVAVVVIAIWAISNEAGWDRRLLFPYLTVLAAVWAGSMGTHSVITHGKNIVDTRAANKRAKDAANTGAPVQSTGQ
jgi:hypothetical protein